MQGRVFDAHLLDMYEFGVDEYISVDEFKGDKKAIGSKPLMIFLGDQWELESSYMSIQNLLLDYFRGFKPEKINLQGVDHVITCACLDGKIHIRGYSVGYAKSGTEVPALSLKPMGPFMDLSLRRSQVAAEDMLKAACKKPKR
jgi:ribosome production factor 2